MALTQTFGLGRRIREVTATLNPASVSAASVAEEAFTVSPISATDIVLGYKAPDSVGIGIGNVYVSAANEITVEFSNPTASPIDAASGAWKFYVIETDE